MSKSRIIAWETDSNLNPTGKERFFISRSCREVVRQIAYELGGQAYNYMVYLPDGTKWCARVYEKIKT